MCGVPIFWIFFGFLEIFVVCLWEVHARFIAIDEDFTVRYTLQNPTTRFMIFYSDTLIS